MPTGSFPHLSLCAALFAFDASVARVALSPHSSYPREPNCPRSHSAGARRCAGCRTWFVKAMTSRLRPRKDMRTKIRSALLVATLLRASMAFAAPDPNFHIFLCFGQSNMEGGGPIEERDRTVDPRFRALADFDQPERGRAMGRWHDAVPPLTRGTRTLFAITSRTSPPTGSGKFRSRTNTTATPTSTS
jgi:hypothetical protein